MNGKKTAVRAAKAIMRAYYGICRFFAREDPRRVLFLNRWSEDVTLDFRMIQEELRRQAPDVKIRTVSCRDGKSLRSRLRFGAAVMRSIRLMPGARVIVLNSYWPAVSILPHGKNQTVVQMWHAAGKIKKTGWQVLGTPAGHSRWMAEEMCMHRGYDVIFAGGPAWDPAYVASFGTTPDKLRNIGLPRLDYLVNSRERERENVLKAYPEFRKKRVILYAPTFRKGRADWSSLDRAVDYSRDILIVKSHPNQKLEESGHRYITCPEFTSQQLMTAADYLITDYSSIAVEAAALGLKTYYFLYDYDEYMRDNGLNLDIPKEMPACTFYDAEELMGAVDGGEYPEEELERYRERFLPVNLGHCTRDGATLIRQALRGREADALQAQTGGGAALRTREMLL